MRMELELSSKYLLGAWVPIPVEHPVGLNERTAPVVAAGVAQWALTKNPFPQERTARIRIFRETGEQHMVVTVERKE